VNSPSFNLVSQPWIPVEQPSGHLTEVSLRDALLRAASYTRIVDASPLVVAALYRLLFAVVYSALRPQDTEEWEELWESGLPIARIDEYLTRHQHRFDLYSPEAPFLQVLAMPESCRSFSWTKLALELPPNSSKLLFSHVATVQPPLGSPAAVARALVSAQAFIVGAGNSCMGYTAHSPLTAALVVIPEGDSLADTILANLPVSTVRDDKPVWEQPPLTAQQVLAEQEGRLWTGPASRLTWLSRAVQLIPEDGLGQVRWIKFAMGFKPPSIEGDRDPWIAYRITKDGVRVPRKLDESRMVWRDFHGMVASTPDAEGESVQYLTRLASLNGSSRAVPAGWTVFVAGVLSDKANVKAWRQERWWVPDVLLHDWTRRRHLGVAMDLAEEIGARVAAAAWHTAAEQLGGADKADPQTIRVVADALPTSGAYWSSLEIEFQRFLRALSEDSSEAFEAWRRVVALAVNNAAQATHMALGRDAIAVRTWAKVSGRFAHLASVARSDSANDSPQQKSEVK